MVIAGHLGGGDHFDGGHHFGGGTRPQPAASGGIQDLGHSFSQYGPPGW